MQITNPTPTIRFPKKTQIASLFPSHFVRFSNTTTNDRPPARIKAGGFFCPEKNAEQKLPSVLQALSDYWIEQMKQQNKQAPIIIATDGTETSQRQFEKIRDHFLQAGIDVYSPFSKIDKEFPMTLGILSYYTRHFAELKLSSEQCAGGLLITVGQNPWRTVGLRIIKPNGAMADPDMIKRLNELVSLPKYLKVNGFKSGKHHPYDFRGKYYDYFHKILNMTILGKGYKDIFHDGLFGATGFFFNNLVYPAIKQIYTIRDRYIDKEVIALGPFLNKSNVSIATKEMESVTCSSKIGFLNDVDGLSARIINNEHKLLTPSDIILVLLNHFVVNKQRSGKIIKSHDTSSSIDELALKFGLPVIEVPSGFNHISPLLDDSAHDILIAADGSGQLTGLNFSPVSDALFTNTAILEASGVERASVTQQLRAIQNKLYYRYITTQHTLQGDYDLQLRVLSKIEKLAQYGGRIGCQKINLKRTLRHNREMKKYYTYKNEYKLFLDDGSWIVAKLKRGSVMLTTESRTLRKKLGWFNQQALSKQHDAFIREIKSTLGRNEFSPIELQAV